MTSTSDVLVPAGTEAGRSVKCRILYIQHAGSPGGSAISLRNTIRLLDRSRFEAIVALVRPSPAMVRLYETEDCELMEWPGIGTFEHTTAYWTGLFRPLTWRTLVETLWYWQRSERSTRELIDKVKPDVVHLNSVVLLPSARALHRAAKRFVWHVRESPVGGRLGLRLRYQSRALRNWTPEVVFLSEAERTLWRGRPTATVVHNFVDDSAYRDLPGKIQVRGGLGIPTTAPVILYVGGLSLIKGILPLLEALELLRGQFPGLVCLMPALKYTSSRRLSSRVARAILPILGQATPAQQVERRIRDRGLESVCHRLPFMDDIEKLYAACDVVVFPALLNHFARPAVEAGAAGRPIVASNLPSVAEVVHDRENGILFEPGNVREMASALKDVLSDELLAARLGIAARRIVDERFEARPLIARLEQCYQRLVGPTTVVQGRQPLQGVG